MATTQLVVKLSKFCNLRCSYCYEYAELGDATRMSLDVLYSVYEQALALVNAGRRIQLIYHGGEPLALPYSYWCELLALQSRVLADAQRFVTTHLQTNLYHFDPMKISLLSNNNVTIGVSIDFIGSERRTARGQATQSQVVENIGRLKRLGISVGAICVLGRHNHYRITDAYRFFKELGIPVRFSPIHKDAFAGQNRDLRLSHDEILSAFLRLGKTYWCELPQIRVRPIHNVIRNCAVRMGLIKPSVRGPRYTNYPQPALVIINTDGGIYNHSDVPGAQEAQGSIGSTPLDRRHTTSAGNIAYATTVKRQYMTCRHCAYFGACDGQYMVEGTTAELTNTDGEIGCHVYGPLHAAFLEMMQSDLNAYNKCCRLFTRH